MLIAPIFFIAGLFITIFSAIISIIVQTIGFVLPAQINTAFAWLISHIAILQGILPITNILTIAQFTLNAYLFIYFIKFSFKLLNLIPTINNFKLPDAR